MSAEPVASWAALAGALGVDAATVFRWRHHPGAPSAPDLDAWRAFLASREQARPAPRPKSEAELEREAADLRFAQARARREERTDALESSRVVTKEQAAGAATLVRNAFVAEGESLPTAVAALLPKFSRVDRQAIEDAVRAAWAEACNRIATGTARG